LQVNRTMFSKTAERFLPNSAQIYCGAMDQVSSMGYPRVGIRDEVAIHFDIFTVRTVRLRDGGHLSMDGQTGARFFPLPFRVNKDPPFVHIWTCIFLPVAHARSHSCDLRASFLQVSSLPS